MAKAQKERPTGLDRNTRVASRGKQTKTGNSSGFRFEGALFRSHPEFNGEVRAHILAPSRMLILAEPVDSGEDDPVMASFLGFLGQDIASRPEQMRPLDHVLTERIDQLTEGMMSSRDDDLGAEITI